MGSYGHSTSVIANGGTTGTSIQTGCSSILAIEMPAAFTGATLTFEGAHAKDGTYQQLVNSAGAAISLTATAGKIIVLTQDQMFQLMSVEFLRPVSASAEGAERSLVFHMK